MGEVATRSFIGRSRELAVLDEALAAALAGRTTMVLVSGDAGVGKTRLLSEWNGRAQDAGAQVAVGTALDLGELGPPYLPITGALRPLLAELDESVLETVVGPDRAVLARVIRELASGESVPWSGSSGELAQVQLFDHFVHLLDRLAALSPLVLELEDLHWADASSLAFLIYLVEALSKSRLLVIGTVRRDEMTPQSRLAATLVQLRRRDRLSTLDLEPFDRAEVRDQLRSILGASPSNALLDAVHQRSEGNALFVEELATAQDPANRLPASVADATAIKAASLGRQAQDLLRAAAVIGRSADDRLLRSVVGMDDAAVDGALREAIRALILEPDLSAGGYSFRHALIHEAVYLDTLPGERRRLHAIVAAELGLAGGNLENDGARAADLARHWYEAGDADRAFRASLVAAEATAKQAAYAESAAMYERAIELWDAATAARTSESRAGILSSAARSWFLAGDLARASRVAERAVAGLGDSPDPTIQLEALVELQRARTESGGEWQDIARLIAELDLGGRPARERIKILENRAWLLLEREEDQAVAVAREAERLALEDGDPVVIAEALNLTGEAMYLVAPGESESIFRRALEAAVESGDVRLEAEIRVALCETLGELHRFEELLAEASTGIALAEYRHLARAEAPTLRFHEGMAFLRLGRLREALQSIELGLADEPFGVRAWRLNLVGAEAHTALGAFDAAASRIEAARDPTIDVDEGRRTYLATVRARYALAVGRQDDVGAIVEHGLRWLLGSPTRIHDHEAVWWLAEVGLAALGDQLDIARAAADEAAVPRLTASASSVVDLLGRIRVRLGARQTARVALASYDLLIAGQRTRVAGIDDPDAWSAAAAAFPPSSLEALTATYRQAEAILRTRGSRDDVRTLLATSHAMAVSMGAGPLADRIAALARRARVDLTLDARARLADGSQDVEGRAPNKPEPAAVEILRGRGLSGRESEVLGLVAAGYSNGQIAERLFITRKTAAVHVSHILDKLGVASRIEAALIAARLGLPDTPTDN